jgi:paraquat-inducible protein B
MTGNKNEENAESENAKTDHVKTDHAQSSPPETKSADHPTEGNSKQQRQRNQAVPTNDLDHKTTLGNVANAPVIVNKSNFSIVWILPIIAVLIGVGMVYNDWQNRGVHIQVVFETAEGLEAKKTVLKNRNVGIGLVKRISFSADKKTILVDIEVSPGQSNIETFAFVGLETPPVTSLNADGIHLKLISRGNKPLKVGNPVLHKGFEVGAVESKYYDDLEQEAHYDIFIHAPFHNLVTENTSFWNVNGLSITTSTQGVSLTMASLDALVAGGVEFGLIDDAEPGVGVPQNHQFQVYDSQESIDEQRNYKFIEYVILVEDSVGGLHKGAPVDYRGVRLGTVSEPYMEFWKIIDIAGVGKEDRIPVVIKLEPERLMKNGYISIDIFKGMVDDWIKEGLTASIENANLITGNLKVSLQPGGKPINGVGQFGEYPVIPAAQGGFASLSKKLENILGELEKLPLNATLANINGLIDSADETVKTSAEVIEKASMTLSALEQSLQELQLTLKGLQPESHVYRSVAQMIKKIEVALDEIKPIVKEVRNQPNSLVFGGPAESDEQPQASKKEGN